jgi:hypothetical protein
MWDIIICQEEQRKERLKKKNVWKSVTRVDESWFLFHIPVTCPATITPSPETASRRCWGQLILPERVVLTGSVGIGRATNLT